MSYIYNNSNTISTKSPASTYEDVGRVSHITKPTAYDDMLEPAAMHDEHQSDNGKLYRVNLNILPIFFLELVALGCLGALAYVLRFTNSFQVLTRILKCEEQDIEVSIPLNMSTFENVYIDISSEILYIVSAFTPLTAILLGEIGCFLFSTNRKVVRAACVSCRLYLPVRRLVRFYGMFIFGYFAVSIVTDGLKLSTGRMRPYYKFLCYSKMSDDELRYARLSFPSYYASISSYAAVYLMGYLHFILPGRASRLLRPSLVFTVGAMSLFCGSHRVALHYNHWEDVIVGYIIGSLAAIYIVFATLERFIERRKPYHDSGMHNTKEDGEKPFFYRYFQIPHVSYQNRSGMPYPEQRQAQSPLLIENGYKNIGLSNSEAGDFRNESNHI